MARHAGLYWAAVVEELTPLGLSQSDTQVEGSGDYVAVLNANGQEVSI